MTLNEIFFQDAVTFLSSHPSVKENVGVIAVSGGAAVGLMMAYNCPQVRKLYLNLIS